VRETYKCKYFHLTIIVILKSVHNFTQHGWPSFGLSRVFVKLGHLDMCALSRSCRKYVTKMKYWKILGPISLCKPTQSFMEPIGIDYIVKLVLMRVICTDY